MLGIRPALTSFLDTLRSFDRVADAKLNPKIARFEQPVPKVTRLTRQFDAFENTDLRQAASRSFTPPPNPGATNVTQFRQGDGFDTAGRKPVELSPRPPPSYKPAIPVFRFR